ncbi:hypothetical protein C8R46DRAFT_1233022 [Mycena filopes]|nr:hypothetical protein C8R46DRAFT_1233022 [Mycena filopes]
MTSHHHLASAAGPPPTAGAPAAGAGSVAAVSQVQRALDALAGALDDLNRLSALFNAPMAIADVQTAILHVAVLTADCQRFHGEVVAAFAAYNQAVTAAGPFISAPQQQQSAPAPVTTAAGPPWVAGTIYSVVPSAPLTAIPDRGEKWFAITRGRYVGLTPNSAISLGAVTGVSTALSGKHSSQQAALAHFNAALQTGAVATL